MTLLKSTVPAALLAVSTGSALAVAPPTDVHPAAVALPGQRDRVLDAERQQRMSLESYELRAFKAKYGDWHVAIWDELTGTPDRAFGEPIQLLTGPVDESAVVQAALGFVTENAAFFGVDAGDLSLESARRARDIYYVRLLQSFGGVPVYEARVLLRIDTSGRLVSFGSDVYPDVSANPFARLSNVAAIASAAEGLTYDTSRDLAQHVRRVILPIHGEDRVDYLTAHEVLLEVDGEKWIAYVDAQTGGVVWREPTTRNVNIIGEFTGEIVEEDPFGPTFDGAMWHQRVFATPANLEGFAEEDGSFEIEYGGTSEQTILALFFAANPHFNIDDNLQMDAVIQEPMTPGVFETLHWDDSNSQQQERIPFYHLQRQREELLAFDPTFPILVDPVNVETNYAGSCNAQWTGTEIRLFRSGGACIATGRIPSVVAHEYGHGLSEWQYGGNLPCALIEAFPDIKAMYYTEQPQVGTGFTGPNTLLRDGRNTLTWDQAVNTCPTGGYPSGECHCKADVTMGAAWKARANLVDKYGEEMGATVAQTAFHSAIYSAPTTPQFYVTDVLLENDDDGNLSNGSPDYDQICAAFEVHGLPCPTLTEFITIDHTPLADTVNEFDARTVVATIVPTNEVLDAANLFVTYRTDGGSWQSVLLTATGGADEYSGDIPAQSSGSYVEYYITAAGEGGAQAEHPNDAPFAAVHRYGIGTFEVGFSDDVESDMGWTLGAVGDEATGGLWVRDDPNGTTFSGQPANPEDDATADPGTDCFFTGQGPPGGSVGQADIDSGCTTLTTPVLDLSSTTLARLSYQRWFYNSGTDADALTVEISTDGGVEWTELESTTGVANVWTEVTFDIPSSAHAMTASTLVRFVACDVASATFTEAAVDEIELTLLTADVTDVADAAPIGRFRMEQNRPNPFNPLTTIRYEVTGSERVSLRIYNVAGQLVRTLVDGLVEPGVHDVAWDGMDGAGRAMASGTYYYRLRAGEVESVRAMALIR